jgi:signal transduction histidine kinase
LRGEVEEANRQLREYAAQAEELATARERNRLAREIHDGVGHYLTVVKTQLDAAAALLPTQPEPAREAVLKASRLAGEALDDVRRSVGTLRTDVARPPLADALRGLTAELGLPVTVRVDGAVRPLAPAVEHALFRSAQEGLTNVRRHAHATTAEVALDFRPADRVLLAVVDNGHGVVSSPNGGFGLRGIRERIQILGGRVEAGNRDEGGFALRVEVPA